MAITFTSRAVGGNTSASSPYTTASITPATDGSPIAAWVATTRATGSSAGAPVSITGLGLTWTLMYAGNSRDAGVNSLRLGLFLGTGTASSGTCSISVGLTIGTLWQFVQMAGSDLTDPFHISTVNSVQSSSTSASQSMSLTLPNMPAAGSGVIAAVVHLASEDISAGSNFAKGTNATIGAPTTAFAQQWKTASVDTTVDATWATSTGYNGVGYEVFASAGGTGPTDFMGDIPI